MCVYVCVRVSQGVCLGARVSGLDQVGVCVCGCESVWAGSVASRYCVCACAGVCVCGCVCLKMCVRDQVHVRAHAHMRVCVSECLPVCL